MADSKKNRSRREKRAARSAAAKAAAMSPETDAGVSDVTASEGADAKSQNTAAENSKNVAPAQKNVKSSTTVAESGKKAQGNLAAKGQFVSPAVNGFLWFLSFCIIIAAIGGNYYYTNYVVVDESSLQRLGRVLAVIVLIVVGLALLIFTNKGHALLDFSRKSYTELRKVFWPTRQEAVQTTFIVFVAVSVVSLFLYLCDVIFLQVVKVITL